VRVIGWNVLAVWPAAAAMWILIALALFELRPRWRLDSLGVIAVLLAALLSLSAISVDRAFTPPSDIVSVAIARTSDRLAASLTKKGRYRLVTDFASVRLAAGVVAELETRGFRFLVDSPVPTIQRLFTSSRLYRGKRVLGTVYLTQGSGPPEAQTARRVSRFFILSGAQRREFARNDKEVRRLIRSQDGLHLTARGERQWARIVRDTGLESTAVNELDVGRRRDLVVVADLYRQRLVARPKLDAQELRVLYDRVAQTDPGLRFRVAYSSGMPR
jgi:hypothetical protein